MAPLPRSSRRSRKIRSFLTPAARLAHSRQETARLTLEPLEPRRLLSVSYHIGQNLAVGQNPGAALVADFNIDGRDDFSVVNANSFTETVFLNSTPLGSGTFSSTAPGSFPIGGGPTGAAVSDFNLDGKPDLITVNQILVTNATLSFLINDTGASSGVPSFLGKQDFTTTGVTVTGGLVAGDLNRDGQDDIAVVSLGGNAVRTYINTTVPGSTIVSLGPAGGLSLVGNQPAALGAADFNGDGILDLVTIDVVNTAHILINQTPMGAATTTLLNPQSFLVGGSFRGPYLADLNDDGKMDLITSDPLQQRINILMNTTATGSNVVSFTSAEVTGLPASPGFGAAADLNGDGRPDIVVPMGAGAIMVLLNTTASGANTPSFDVPLFFKVVEPVASIAVGEFNGGLPDLVLVNENSNTATVRLSFPSAGQTYFADTFNRADNANVNASTDGQAGNLAPLTYVTVGTSAIAMNQLTLTGSTTPDQNFVPALGLSATQGQVAFTLNPPDTVDMGGVADWGGVAIGLTGADAMAAATVKMTGTKAFGVRFRGDSGTQAGQMDVFLNGGSVLDTQTFDTTPTMTESYDVSVTVVADAGQALFTAGQTATATVEVKGELNAGAGQDTFTRQYNVVWVGNENFVVLESQGASAFNDLSINDGIDNPPGTGVVTAPAVTVPYDNVYQFSVIYTDDAAVQVSTLGNTDVIVSGPGGFGTTARLVSATPNVDNPFITAVYEITPPGGIWDGGDNGIYSIAVQNGAVTDIAGQPIVGAIVGGFNVSLPGGSVQVTGFDAMVSPVNIVSGDLTPDTGDGTDFGTITEGDAPVLQSFTIINQAAGTLNLSNLNVPAGYTVINPLAASLPAGGMDNIILQLDSAIVGAKTGLVTFDSDTGGTPVTFSFAITGTVNQLLTPEIGVESNGISFVSGDTTPDVADGTDLGSVPLGTPGPQTTFTITNTGTADLDLFFLDIPFGFTLVQDMGFTLPVGMTDTFIIGLDTSVAGPRTGTITLFNSDTDEGSFTFAMTGDVTTAPDIEITGNNVIIVSGDTTPSLSDNSDFGPTSISGDTVVRTYAIRNAGSADLTLAPNPVSISGPDAASFTILRQPETFLVPGAATTFQIAFQAGEIRTYNATVNIPSDDPDEANFTFDITGEGTPRTQRAEIGGFIRNGIVSDGRDNLFRLSYSGPGVARVLNEQDGRITIRAEGSDASSKLTVSQLRGDGTLFSLEADGPINSIIASNITLLGHVLIDGGITKFTAGDIISNPIDDLQHTVRFGGASTDKPLAITLGNITNVTMTSGAPVGVTVLSWTDDDQIDRPDKLTAPWGTAFAAKGDRRNDIPAQWDADVLLSGQDALKETLKSFKADSLQDAKFDITGAVGSIDLSKGTVDGLDATIVGDLGSLKLGDTAQAIVNAGITGAVTAVRWLTGALGATTIKSIATSGNSKTGVAGNFGANVTVTGDGDAKADVGKSTFKGNLTGQWNVGGPVDAITADAVTAGFSAVIAGPLSAMSLKLGGFTGLLVASSIGKFDAKGDLSDASIIAGSAFDAINAIASFKLGGRLVTSTIKAGVRPGADGLFNTADDQLINSPANAISDLLIVGTASPLNQQIFFAGSFGKASIMGQVVNPFSDARFG